MILNCGVGEDSLESSISPEYSVEGLCWSWNSNTLATWCEEVTHWTIPWCWGRLKAGREEDGRGWDGWRASPIWLTWVEQALGVADGQGSIRYCIPWGCKESDMTQQLNLTKPGRVKVTQLCLTLCDPMDYTVYGILQARILEWGAIPFSRGSFQPRGRTQVSRTAGGFFTSWATWEACSNL